MKSLASIGFASFWLASLLLAGCGDGHEEDGHDSPSITTVAWAHTAPCVSGTASDVVVTITAVDPNTPLQDLTYSGSVSGCTGTITAAVSTVNCPQALPYQATVTVADEEVHTDTLDFTIEVCVDGQAQGD
jgi:hypothetical protein